MVLNSSKLAVAWTDLPIIPDVALSDRMTSCA